ncbi:prostatic acid phosphatase isoform X2 [Leptinotarsa decemlineata]|uniref:prostatic acid phosphatase isoform X2 n=1 Tax=Leptinotarsa decemlineata TaxID=7539 RepID=UPI003D309B4D
MESKESKLKEVPQMGKWSTSAGIAMGVAAVLVFLVIGFKALQISGDDPKTLEMVHVVMRHGTRTPASTYPNDPYINETFYPIGWGQITNEGKLHLFNVGKFLRERYGSFLGTHYSPDEYYTQSTGVDRTKVSMQMVNAGLWPPVGEQKWGPLDWQPIPVSSEPLDQDSLLLVRRPCPQYHIEKERVMNSPEVKSMMAEYEDLFRELTEITGQKVEDFDGVQDIYSTLMAEEAFNLTLPDWTKNYYPKKMFTPTVKSFILNVYTDKMNRLKGGVLLKKLLEDWTSKSEGSIKQKTKKAFLYGGHDSTVVNILRALKVWDDQFPGYAITVLFELYKDRATNTYGVEIYLRNSTVVPPFKLTIPGCESFCPLTKLKELTTDVIPVDWDEECKTDDKDFVVPELGGP